MNDLTNRFASKVFDLGTMKQRLPKDTYREMLRCIRDGKRLDISVANIVANAMKDWAIEQGATHFTHWFQPMTGITAEKHDGFISPRKRRRRHHHGILRQGAGAGRIGRLVLPVGRAAVHLRGPGLHRLGPHLLRLHQGHGALHPHGVLQLRRRGAGHEDAAAAVHGGHQPPGHPHTEAVRPRGTSRPSPPWARSRSISWWISPWWISGRT